MVGFGRRETRQSLGNSEAQSQGAAHFSANCLFSLSFSLTYTSSVILFLAIEVG